MKILATTPIPTQDLFALRNQLRVLDDQVEKLINYAFVEDPKTEATPAPKVEATPAPKAEATPAPKAEPKRKPFEMVIE